MALDMASAQEQVDKLRAVLRTGLDGLPPGHIQPMLAATRGVMLADDTLPMTRVMAAATLVGVYQAMLDDLAERGE